MELRFTKMNGAGNDFVVIDNRTRQFSLDGKTIARLCDRHRGVGADGLLAVEPAEGQADFRMRYYNADGGFVNRLHHDELSFVQFETLAGLISAEFEGEQVRINMSAPHSLKLAQELTVAGQTLTVHSINTGVPHAVVLVDDLERVPVREWGAGLRYHEAFAPKGTNANFVQVLGLDRIAIRTYERGVEDETLACGTGMVASALIHHELTGVPSPVAVTVRGGDTLRVGFEETAPHEYSSVTLLGPADVVFQGTVEI